MINFNNNYIQNLIENYTDDMDTFIKNNKDNIINMLYNNTKKYKIIWKLYKWYGYIYKEQ